MKLDYTHLRIAVAIKARPLTSQPVPYESPDYRKVFSVDPEATFASVIEGAKSAWLEPVSIANIEVLGTLEPHLHTLYQPLVTGVGV